jgi:hypothetical protein
MSGGFGPYFFDMKNTIEFGDCRETMRRWAAKGIKAQTCVTSPPYYGLRDYGHEGQIGLEETLEEYIKAMVEVFRCVRDVLADDGTLWLNIGDSYAMANMRGENSTFSGNVGAHAGYKIGSVKLGKRLIPFGLKAKDLIGIPWMLAFALRADGWYLRQDIIWHKPNPMPESVQDRCTKAHEYIFLLSKSERYYFDNDAIKEPVTDVSIARAGRADLREKKGWAEAYHGNPPTGLKRSGNKERKPASARGVPVDTAGKTSGAVAGNVPWEGTTRNKRDVWSVSVKPYKGAHFATFPSALIEPCILAGAPAGGVVLDPFMGSGTTAAVAIAHGRNYLGCELNPAYKALQDARIGAPKPTDLFGVTIL